MIPFSRYDVLLYELGRLMLTDIKGESHVLNKAYRSYNTYRKNITPDSSKLKINETYNNRDAIEENYYDLNSLDTSYVFDGIVLSKKYATNGNEMSLEDLFSEYYYEYLTAVDSSYLYSPEYGTTYYFNQSYINPITQEEVVGGTYEILPQGSTYRDEDGIVSMVEYDGKYVPTVGELLSGLLYIVIQSEGKPARKIFFNNTCLPTLFINDDKYYTIDDYILNNNQLMRLCDVKLFSRLGVRIAWKDIAYLDGESVKNMLSNIGSDAHNLWFNNQIGKDQVFFRIYYKGWYMNSASNEDVIFIKGQKKIDVDWNGTTFNNLNEDFSDGVVNNPENGSWIWRDDEEAEVEFMPLYFLKDQDRTFLNYSTGYIAAANVDNHIIKVHLQFGISLILKGYTFNEQPDDSYTLQWYKYTEETPQPVGDLPLSWSVINYTNGVYNAWDIAFNNGLHIIEPGFAGIGKGQTRNGVTLINDASSSLPFTLSSNVYNSTTYMAVDKSPYVWDSSGRQPLGIALFDTNQIPVKYTAYNTGTSTKYRSIQSLHFILYTADNSSVGQGSHGGGITYGANHTGVSLNIAIEHANKPLNVSLVSLNLATPVVGDTDVSYHYYELYASSARANERRAEHPTASGENVSVGSLAPLISIQNSNKSALYYLNDTNASLGISINTGMDAFYE